MRLNAGDWGRLVCRKGNFMNGADPRRWMWAEACAMIARAEQLHRQFFQPGVSASPAPNWEPPVDIFESNEGVTIFAALPGVDAADLTISLEPGLLVVAGLRRLPTMARGMAIHRLEIPHGRFERRIPMPSGRWQVERSSLQNGCLSLSLVASR
jgi:HSP20 family molecular chaperone IbpA